MHEKLQDLITTFELETPPPFERTSYDYNLCVVGLLREIFTRIIALEEAAEALESKPEPLPPHVSNPITEHDLAMLIYSLERHGTPTRWGQWEKRKEVLKAHMPGCYQKIAELEKQRAEVHEYLSYYKEAIVKS